VGGAVRDALLGLPNSDWDLATAATPAQIQRLFRRTVPVGEAHGTIGVFGVDDVMHEVTTFRRDVRTDGRHAEVEFGASLDEDLARRDFTINAIAVKARTGTLRDPFDGRGDLARRVIRAVGAPADRMREDRLRALRAMRFAARFEFTIEPTTWRAVVDSAPFLQPLSAERVNQELEKVMEQVARPSVAIGMWRESGALAALVPALAAIGPVTVRALDCLPRARGKTDVGRTWRRVDALFWELDGVTARAAAIALRLPNVRARMIDHLAACWQRLGATLDDGLAGARAEDRALRRWVAVAGRTDFRDFWRIAAARWSARRALGLAAPSAAVVRDAYRRGLRLAFGATPLAIADLAIDGNDLIRLGIPKGRRIREILEQMLDAVLDDPTRNTAADLAALATRLGRV